MQAFDADLLVADPGNLGGWALADALNIHKAIVQVPGFTPPLVRHVHTLHHQTSWTLHAATACRRCAAES